MQVCTSLQTDNHASTPPLCFLQAGCPSCRPTNNVKALKAKEHNRKTVTKFQSESHYITLVVFSRAKYSRNKFFSCQNYRNFSLQIAIINARYKTSWTISADLSTRGSTTTRVTTIWILLKQGWCRGTVVERRALAGELSLSCDRPAADG